MMMWAESDHMTCLNQPYAEFVLDPELLLFVLYLLKPGDSILPVALPSSLLCLSR